MKRILIVHCCFFALTLCSKLYALEQRMIKSLGFKPGQVSYYVQKLNAKKQIKSHQESMPFLPASTQKTLSAILALETLGEDHRFFTTVSYTGQISSGQLDGDLHLIGGGDPYLQYSDLFELALKVKSRGINTIRGKLYFDQSLLGKDTIIESDGLIDEGYNSGVSALSVNFNQAHIFKENGVFKSLADGHLIKFSASSKSFPRKMNFMGSSSNGQWRDDWLYSSNKNYKNLIRVPIRNPAHYTAQVFHYFLKLLGIKSAPPLELKKERPMLRELHSIKSLSVAKLISLNFEYSNNLISELLLMHSIKKLQKKKCNIIKCALYMQEWFKQKFNLKEKNFKLVNGSGLGGHNQISTKDFVKIFSSFAYKLWPLLPISAIKGSLAKRYQKQSQSFKIWAKTGSIDFVSGLTGIFISKTNQHYVFSILINDHKKRRKLIQTPLQESYGLRQLAPNWKRKANQLEDQFLQHWIKTL